jgi:type I restriction enzyme S subunit
MANDWDEAPLKDLVEVIRETVDPQCHADEYFLHFSIPAYDAGRVPQVQLGSEIGSQKQVVEDGCILVSRLNPRISRVWYVQGIKHRCGLASTEFLVFRPDPAVADTQFLRYVCQAPKFVDVLTSRASGTSGSHQRVRTADVLSIAVPTPKLPEQQAIGAVLRALDDKIELNRRMAQTLEEMARALFKSWFVDFDPVRAKAEGRDPGLPKHLADLFPDRLVDSDLGEIPEGWTVRALDELAHFLNGLAMQKFPPEVGVPTLPVIKIAQLRAGNTLGADLATSALKADYIVEDGDILFSWSGTLECVYWSGGPGALNQHLFKVIPKEVPNSICYLAVHEFLDHFRGIAAGKATTMGHIQRRDLSAAKLPIPPDDLMQEAGALFDVLLERSWRCRVEARSLGRLRDSLLPQLVSGDVRLPDPEGLLARLGAVS